MIEHDPLSSALLQGVIAIDCKEIIDPEAIEHFFIKIVSKRAFQGKSKMNSSNFSSLLTLLLPWSY